MESGLSLFTIWRPHCSLFYPTAILPAFKIQLWGEKGAYKYEGFNVLSFDELLQLRGGICCVSVVFYCSVFLSCRWWPWLPVIHLFARLFQLWVISDWHLDVNVLTIYGYFSKCPHFNSVSKLFHRTLGGNLLQECVLVQRLWYLGLTLDHLCLWRKDVWLEISRDFRRVLPHHKSSVTFLSCCCQCLGTCASLPWEHL